LARHGIDGEIVEVTVSKPSADQKSVLFRDIGAALHFPSYYGQNLDALAECLSDLSWIPATMVVLVIRNFSFLEDGMQQILREVFVDAESSHNPPRLTVILA
jgi:RNAse (barnase) inhibitor barstar